MEYHRIKDILYVKEMLCHKGIAGTMICTSVGFEPCMPVRTAKTLKEDEELNSASFEFVTE
jgi:hypothetical protein